MTLCFSLSWVNKVWPRNLKKWWIVCKLGRVLLESALIKNSSHNAFSFPCNLPEPCCNSRLVQKSRNSRSRSKGKRRETEKYKERRAKRGKKQFMAWESYKNTSSALKYVESCSCCCMHFFLELLLSIVCKPRGQAKKSMKNRIFNWKWVPSPVP